MILLLLSACKVIDATGFESDSDVNILGVLDLSILGTAEQEVIGTMRHTTVSG